VAGGRGRRSWRRCACLRRLGATARRRGTTGRRLGTTGRWRGTSRRLGIPTARGGFLELLAQSERGGVVRRLLGLFRSQHRTHHVDALEQNVEQLGAHRKMAAAHFIQQRFHLVSERGDRGETKRRAAALDRMGAPEDRVDAFGIDRPGVQLQERRFHRVE
jgi:hypothetical protein